GMLGHIEDYCDKLYSLQSDDGTRNWGPELRVVRQRNKGSGGARWLREEGKDWQPPSSETAVTNHAG
ncbi:hypothetical protein A2U01_0119160, partial [Trifolium medium]|nr:hypothetical protein [Trifolium medium]